ncbi:hypothetical protein J4474_04460 [Candidatus Pacearchaeota archaeon]|nr:hypothetical protein [Candidatus Pacearchaeota archaeon]
MSSIERIIFIDERHLESLLRSGIETYPRETLGTVFGTLKKEKNSFIWEVSAVHPIQLATRKEDEVKAYENIVNEDWSMINPHIGNYHSHNYDFNNQDRLTRGISKEDKEAHSENSEEIELIINLYKIPKRFRLTNNPQVISGNLPLENIGYYRFDIIGYSWINKRILRTKMQTTKRFYQKVKELNY